MIWTDFEVAIVIRAHPGYCHRSHVCNFVVPKILA